MKVLCVEGTWVVRTKGEIDPQVTYSGCRSLTVSQFGARSLIPQKLSLKSTFRKILIDNENHDVID